jgi:hypothetical protein
MDVDRYEETRQDRIGHIGEGIAFALPPPRLMFYRTMKMKMKMKKDSRPPGRIWM